eukprot:525770_1
MSAAVELEHSGGNVTISPEGQSSTTRMMSLSASPRGHCSHNTQSYCTSSSVASQHSLQCNSLAESVSGLQSDLGKAIGVSQVLRDENSKLKRNYEIVKGELIKVKERFTNQRTQLLDTLEAKIASDQETEALIQKWKAQLEARTCELEALQAQMVPQDLDLLQLQVAEELGSQHRLKVERLESEVEKQRQMFFNVRREYERCKAEYEQYTIDQSKELQSLESARHADAHTLKMKISELENSLADAIRGEESRRLGRLLEEAKSRETTLREELNSVRKAKEKCEIAKYEAALEYQQSAGLMLEQRASLEADRSRLYLQVEELKSDVRRATDEMDARQTRVKKLEMELVMLRTSAEDHSKELATAKSEAMQESAALKASLMAEIHDLKAQVEMHSHRASAANHRCKEVTEKANHRMGLAEELEARVRQEANKQLSGARDEVCELEVEIERLGSTASQAEATLTSKALQWQTEVEEAQEKLSQLLKEREITVQRMAQDKEQMEKFQQDREQMSRLADEANSRGDRLASVLEGLKSERKDMKVTIARMESDLRNVSNEMDGLRAGHLQAIKDIKSTALKQRKAHTENMVSEMTDLRRRARKELRRERKRGDTYKEYALEVKHKSRALGLQSKAATQGAEMVGIAAALARIQNSREDNDPQVVTAKGPLDEPPSLQTGGSHESKE